MSYNAKTFTMILYVKQFVLFTQQNKPKRRKEEQNISLSAAQQIAKFALTHLAD